MGKEKSKKGSATPPGPNGSGSAKAPEEAPKKRYYKHPWKNTTLALIIPNRAEKRVGLSIELIDFLYETEDPKIQQLLEARPEFHKDGIEEIDEKLAERMKRARRKAQQQYQEGPSRLRMKG